jgi:hypothetical protein
MEVYDDEQRKSWAGAPTLVRAVVLALPIPQRHGRARILSHMQFST